MDSLFGNLPVDTAYCAGRALIIAIVVSSELAVAGRKRIGFERNLLLGLGFAVLLFAELFTGTLRVLLSADPNCCWSRLLHLYPALIAVGLVVVAFAGDYCRFANEPERIRRRGRFTFGVMLAILALGMVLAVTAPDAVPIARAAAADPAFIGTSSIDNIGGWSIALHGLPLLAALWLMGAVRHHDPGLLTLRQSEIFMYGCIAVAAGAVLQMHYGPREHLTTFGLAIFAAVLLRYLYIESGLESIRATEKASTRMLMFHRTTTQLKSTFDERELCEILLDGLLTNLGAESGGVFFLDEKKAFLRAKLVFGPMPPPLPLATMPEEERELHRAILAQSIPLGEGPVGKVAETGRTHYVFDAPDDGSPLTTKTAVVMPVETPKEIFGVVQVVNRHDGGPFTEEDVRFMSLIVEHASLALANARLQEQQLRSQRTFEQLRVAREIQLSLIPSSLEKVPGIRSYAVYRPANEVGGDYYDLYRLDDQHVGLAIADVSGKGIPAALVMALTSTALKTLAPSMLSPRLALIRLNEALYQEIQRGMFVTAAYAVLDLEAREMRLASAGHESVLVRRAGRKACEFHRPKGAAIGLLPTERFEKVIEETTIRLEEGDAVLMYTDGVTESMNVHKQPLGVEGLHDLVLTHENESPEEMLEHILEAVDRYTGRASQYDDITMVAMQVNGKPATTSAASEGDAEPG